MRSVKILSLSFLLFISGSLAFAGSNSYIKITSPEPDEYQYAYNDSLKNYKVTITGSVSADCVSIRALWSPVSFKVLEEYLVNRKKNPGEDSYIDDFVLKQYKKGERSFIYNVSGGLDNLQYGSNYYKFVASFSDGSIKICDFQMFVYNGGAAEKGKPVIYLYPETEQKISVKVEPKGGVTKSIPEYKNGWNVTATPESIITNLSDKEEYPYLFWESDDDSAETDMTSGFVVETKKLQSFFEEKLALLGLNEIEIKDFTEFWVPELQGKKYVFITFYSQQRIDEEAPLTVKPAPDTVIRVFFDHKKLDKKIKVTPQKLSAPERKGFTVVEWGGKRYK